MIIGKDFAGSSPGSTMEKLFKSINWILFWMPGAGYLKKIYGLWMFPGSQDPGFHPFTGGDFG
jgi:hypothetical protein